MQCSCVCCCVARHALRGWVLGYLTRHTEVEAARKAGLHAILVVRPGNPPQETEAGEKPIRSLRELKLGA